jgi:hypothetical protein
MKSLSTDKCDELHFSELEPNMLFACRQASGAHEATAALQSSMAEAPVT